MTLPVLTPGSGSSDLFLLQQGDRDILRLLIEDTRQRLEQKENRSDGEFYIPAQEVLICKMPEKGIKRYTLQDEAVPAGGENEKVISSELCEIYRLKFKDELDLTKPITIVALQADVDLAVEQVRVYNPYPVSWYGPNGNATIYFNATRTRQGVFICERPPYFHKVRPTEDCEPGMEVKCDVIIGGITFEEPEQIKVRLDWASGGDKISSGKDAFAKFLPNEGIWIFTGADCEFA